MRTKGCKNHGTMYACAVAFLVAWFVQNYGADSEEIHNYLVCKNHYAASRIREKRFEDRRITCAFYCGQHYWCRAFTIYSNGLSVECHFNDGIFNIDGCNSFPVNINVRLLIKKEVYVMPSENGCFNGATLSGDHCKCQYGFSGSKCERYITDCKEGKDIGLSSIAPVAPVMIKPTNFNFAFEARCNFNWGLTVVLQRNDASYNLPFNRSWDEYKYSFGVEDNYWIGLEGMYRVVNQTGAVFKLQVYCKNNALNVGFSVYYATFSIGSEASRYAMKIGDVLVDPGNEGSDGLGQNSVSIPFCTYDKPCSGYPDSHGGGWWYVHVVPKMAYALTAPVGQINWLYQYANFSTDVVSISLERLS